MASLISFQSQPIGLLGKDAPTPAGGYGGYWGVCWRRTRSGFKIENIHESGPEDSLLASLIKPFSAYEGEVQEYLLQHICNSEKVKSNLHVHQYRKKQTNWMRPY